MKINKRELKELFEGIRERNEMKFNELYSNYNKLIYSIAFSILKNEEESKEIEQIVFMKIWNMDKTKLPTKNELSWLYTLTKNEAISYLRNKKEEVSIESLYEIGSEDKEIDKMLDIDKYNRIISNLDEKEREIISLKIISGFSFREISQMLKLPIGTVQWRYYKAINTLKRIIANITMFIVAIGIYIRRTLFSKNINIGEDSTQEKIKEDTEKSQEESVIQQEENIVKESSKQESLENIYDAIENVIEENVTEQNSNKENEIKENVIVDDRKDEANKNYQNSVINNILLGLAIFFLVISVILSKFFIKNQQNTKEKTSK